MITIGVENSSGSIVFLDNFLGLLCNFPGLLVAALVRVLFLGRLGARGLGVELVGLPLLH